MSRRTYPHHVSLYLDDAQRELLSKIVSQTQVSASTHLRRALAFYVESGVHRSILFKPQPKPSSTPHSHAGRTGERLPWLFLWSD